MIDVHDDENDNDEREMTRYSDDRDDNDDDDTAPFATRTAGHPLHDYHAGCKNLWC
jgi:hypothetical protein